MLKLVWRRFLAEPIARSVAARLERPLGDRIAARIAESRVADAAPAALGAFADLAGRIAALEERAATEKPWDRNLFVPPVGLHPKLPGPFMSYSTCSTADFLNPEFERICGIIGRELQYHRKLWEWAFIVHHAFRTGAVGPGRRALAFAVGSEPLPCAFAAAGTDVTATDAPPEIGVQQGWQATNQLATRLEDLYFSNVVDRATFLKQVVFSTCDMNAIDPALTGFDFCWSSCSFEHLGTIERGLDFVVESVERTLKPGGVACHTTEFNLSSDRGTIEDGGTVLYRRSDIARLVERLERRGHTVAPFRVAPDSHILDFYADTPPYHGSPHLRLRLLGYVTTSVGLVITRGGG